MDAQIHISSTGGALASIGPAAPRDLDALGWDFQRVYPVDMGPRFDDLLRAIDAADIERARPGAISRLSARPGPAAR